MNILKKMLRKLLKLEMNNQQVDEIKLHTRKEVRKTAMLLVVTNRKIEKTQTYYIAKAAGII